MGWKVFVVSLERKACGTAIGRAAVAVQWLVDARTDAGRRGTVLMQGSVMQVMPAKAAPHWLVATASIVIIVAGVGWFGTTVWETRRAIMHDAKALADEAQAKAEAAERERKAIPKIGEMEDLSFANADGAHVTMTNMGDDVLYNCMRGVVTSKATRNTTRSVAVCTGAVQPHSTVTLDAPFRVGAVRELCSGKPDAFGNRHVDWDLCGFELEPATASTGPVVPITHP